MKLRIEDARGNITSQGSVGETAAEAIHLQHDNYTFLSFSLASTQNTRTPTVSLNIFRYSC